MSNEQTLLFKSKFLNTAGEHTVAEHLAAKQPDTSFRKNCLTELNESEYWINIH